MLPISSFRLSLWFSAFSVCLCAHLAHATQPHPLSDAALRFEFVGNETISSDELSRALGELRPSELTQARLSEIEDQIFSIYADKGLVGTARVADQVIENGTLLIGVDEGRLASIEVVAPEGLRLSKDRIARVASKELEVGGVVEVAALEKAISRLDSYAGISSKILLRPGSSSKEIGALVDVSSAKLANGRVQLDNLGAEASGAERLTANLELNSLLRLGEQSSVGFTASEHSSLAMADFILPVVDTGVSISASLRYSSYDIPNEVIPSQIFEGFKGDATSIYLKASPVDISVGDWTFSPAIELARTTARDDLSFTEARLNSVDKEINYLSLPITASFEAPASLLAVSANVALDFGEVDYRNAQNAQRDTFTTRAAGDYKRLRFDSRVQKGLSPTQAVTVSISGQLATANLDRTQEFLIAGPTAVRGYDVGLFSVDEAVVLKADLTQAINKALSLFVFADTGYGTTHTRNFESDVAPSGAPNSFRLSSVGFGANLTFLGSLVLNIQLSKAIGGCTPCLPGTDTGQVWAVLSGTF